MENETPQKPLARKKVRSSSYPSLTLEKSLNAIRAVKESLGNGPFDRFSVAQAMSYKSLSGAASTSVASLVHFGLLTRSGDVYQVSSLAESFLNYRDEAERQAAIVEAAKNPKLFSDLITKFGGKSLPSMLDNILVRDHGINERVATSVKTIFVASMTYAGLYENGILKDSEYAPVPNRLSTAPEELGASDAPASTPVVGTSASAPVSGVIPITAGFSIAYPDTVPLFTLMTDSEFVAAASSLKDAIDKLVQPSAAEDASDNNAEAA